ncbi:uncharacterized protein LOC141641122 [Silene latifolia]|uniref:uncharacterized protein LOC141641122 n=1 Tax=Silene latifolia TaxID=37657 RepID=UPI003D782520
MRQRRWIELIGYYDMEIIYHEGKANVVADALSRKSVHALCTAMSRMKLREEVERMGISMIKNGDTIGDLTIEPELYEEIRKKQEGDARVARWRGAVGEAMVKGGKKRFHMGSDGGLRVKGEHKRPQSKVQSLDVPEWMWESILMDFIVGLPNTQRGNNMIWVIVDRLTKSAHFIPIKDTRSKAELAKAYVKNVVKLHGVPKDIVSDRDSSYHASIGIAPFEALYGRKCRSPVCWDDRADAVVLGPEMNKKWWSRKYVSDPTHVLEPEHVEIDEQLSYVEEPKEILDRKMRKTRNGETALVKILWSNHKVEEATWEAEAAMREKYPSLFV